MRIVVALGGNAISPRGDLLTVGSQRRAIARAAVPLARIAAEHEVVITHGNGPQVGLLALQAAALDPDNDFSLDVLDAETAGLIGYLIEVELSGRLPAGRGCVTLLTRTLVDRTDPAFSDPAKFVGPQYDDQTAQRLAAEHGWSFRIDGDRPRRVVPSPEPLAVLSVAPIDLLLHGGHTVICGGGGGIPVVRRGRRLVGVDAVVDKDAVSALIAEQVHADQLVIATDVDAVYQDWGTPLQRRLDLIDVARRPLEEFPAGSMRPKVEAAARFARSGGTATIGALSDLPALLDRRAGTRVVDTSRASTGAPTILRGDAGTADLALRPDDPGVAPGMSALWT